VQIEAGEVAWLPNTGRFRGHLYLSRSDHLALYLCIRGFIAVARYEHACKMYRLHPVKTRIIMKTAGTLDCSSVIYSTILSKVVCVTRNRA
jgi:hypothetical protein